MAADNLLFSIIVPIYNVEKYLARCVDSILNQTYRNIEIILVDDDSPDRCGMLCDEYALKDPRIRVIHQKNKWLGGARNSGLQIATGKYILFVDSDDFVREDMCEKLLAYLNGHDVDMILFDMYHTDIGGKIKSISGNSIEPNTIYCGSRGRSVLYNLVIQTHEINSACQKCYRRTLLTDHDLYFNEEIRYAEDYEFCLRLFPQVESYIHLDQPYYYYVQNDESIMNKTDPKIVEKFIVLYRYREAFLQRHGVQTAENEIYSANLLMKMLITYLPKYLNGRSSVLEKRKAIRSMCNYDEVIKAASLGAPAKTDLGRYGKIQWFGIRYKLYDVIYMIYRLEGFIHSQRALFGIKKIRRKECDMAG